MVIYFSLKNNWIFSRHSISFRRLTSIVQSSRGICEYFKRLWLISLISLLASHKNDTDETPQLDRKSSKNCYRFLNSKSTQNIEHEIIWVFSDYISCIIWELRREDLKMIQWNLDLACPFWVFYTDHQLSFLNFSISIAAKLSSSSGQAASVLGHARV